MAKVRLNGDSSGFIELAAPNAAGSNTLTLPTSNGSANQLLKNSGTAGALAWSTLTEDSSGNLNVDSGTFFVDATNNRVGIGTTSPAEKLHVFGTGQAILKVTGDSSTDGAYLLLQNSNTTANCFTAIQGNDAGGNGTSEIKFVNVSDANNEGLMVFSTRPSGGSMTERARIDSSGRLLVGTSTATGGREKLQVMGNTSDTAGSGEMTLAKGSSVSSGDLIGVVNFTSSTNQSFATITAFADATTGTNDFPGRLVFSTTADGASSPTERLRIANDGSISSVIPGGSTLFPRFGCRAWVNFNGTGTVAIRANGNVSSITDNGTGDYTVNFTTALADANYSVMGCVREDLTDTSLGGRLFQLRRTPSLSSSIRVGVSNLSNAAFDEGTVTVAVFR